MNVVFWTSLKQHEMTLADAFVMGVNTRRGDFAYTRSKLNYIEPIGDVGVFIGVKNLVLIEAYQRVGRPYVYMDKGAFRISRNDGKYRNFLKQKYWKISVNSFQPLAYMRDDRDGERWDMILEDAPQLVMKPFREEGEHIVVSGPSGKYARFFNLGSATAWAAKIVGQIRDHSSRPITYRPKHSWKDAEPIDGTFFSRPPRKLHEDLEQAWCIVTHGSNSSAEAILAGIPVVALGPAISWPVSSNQVHEVKDPRIPTEEERRRWLNALAYTMWTLEEMESGEAWDEVRDFLPV